MLNLCIRTITNKKDLGRLRNYLLHQGLWYPDYEPWVEEVCIPDIEREWKTGILALCDGKVVGDAIYQPHKKLPRTREFKNMRIQSEFRRRDLGHFLLRQVEEEDSKSFDRIILDVDAREERTVHFLQFCGYRPILQQPLYSSHNVDVVMVKEFKRDIN